MVILHAENSVDDVLIKPFYAPVGWIIESSEPCAKLWIEYYLFCADYLGYSSKISRMFEAGGLGDY